MIRRSFLLQGAVALTAVLAAAGARADLLDDVKAAKRIRIAIDLGVPPYGMTDGQMKPTGSDVETARLLARDLGVELEIV
jgi:polar amino acid transport system substrate-binding protein